MESPWTFGLDLGQAGDYSTLVGLFSAPALPLGLGQGAKTEGRPTFHALALHRWPLDTSYYAVAADVARWTSPHFLAGVPQGPLTKAQLLRPRLAVDFTGVGRAVYEIIVRAEHLHPTPVPITITGGHQPRPDGGGWHVPKKELVAAVQVLLQGRRLVVPPGRPEAEVLRREMVNFKVKITAAMNEQYGPWREREHDDLLLALACAAWLADRAPKRVFNMGV